MTPMPYRNLGHSGLKLSLLSFGSWVTLGHQVNKETAKACLYAALDHGVNFIDSAEAYAHGAAEILIGELIQGLTRSDLVLSSKVFWGGAGPNDTGLSRKHVFEACHAALRRLKVDYLDLYFCHRPDPDTPLFETIMTMDMLVRQGKVLYWGTSEWPPSLIEQCFEICRQHRLIPPSMEQPEYNFFARSNLEQGLQPLCQKYGLGTTTWSPLASGILTGKYNHGIPEDSRFAVEGYEWLRDDITPSKLAQVAALKSLAQELGCSTAQLALAWCTLHPSVSTVITGASRPEQVHENMAAIDVIPKLSPEIQNRIEHIFLVAKSR